MKLTGLTDYYELFVKNNKTDDDIAKVKFLNEEYRKTIEDNFKRQIEFNYLFKKDLFGKLLPKFILYNDSKYSKYTSLLNSFKSFTTYFKGFQENRKNIYTKNEVSTSIPYRIINDNLPIFISNVKNFNKNLVVIKRIISEANNEMMCFDNIDSIFEINNFNNVLTQKGIDDYNRIIGGYVKDEGLKIQGVNELINLYNQKIDKHNRIPEFIKLKKQILSDVDCNGFVFERYEDDKELSDSLIKLYDEIKGECFKDEIGIDKLFESIEEYDLSKIYIKNSMVLTNLSNEIYGSWNIIKNAYYVKYTLDNCDDYDKFNSYYKNIKQFNLRDIIETVSDYGNLNGIDILNKFKHIEVNGINILKEFDEKYNELTSIINSATHNKYFIKNDNVIQKIKEFLDAGKEIQGFISVFDAGEEITDKDELFYSYLKEYSSHLNLINDLYNNVRNYLTQKPYSELKYKLNFDKPTLLDGWDVNKEKDNLSVIFKRDGKFYLGIINRNCSNLFVNVDECQDNDYYEKMEYKLIPGAYKTLPGIFLKSQKGMDIYNPPEYIIEGYNAKKHLKNERNFDKQFLIDLIDFYKEKLQIYYTMYRFNFKESKDYADISEFYNDVDNQGYFIKYKKISANWIDRMVYENKLYLFQIYNKDFSKYSKGKKNLHTLYWEAIFSEENMKNVIYKLDGGAELFYRPASLDLNDTAVHKANCSVLNKNKDNQKKDSLFKYDIIKNKRYTEDKFLFHVPVSLNYNNQKNVNINATVNYNIKYSDDINVIGIDRGERNLLYISVINSKGEILEQHSLNEIVNEYNGNTYKVNYHDLLDRKEKERQAARESWKTVNNIKELKEGYISVVINKIIKLMEKYKAIIVLEDLNYGFKNSRVKVEKQIYQKFEKALIEKLNFLVIKDKDFNEYGGLYKPYQLTNKFISFNKLGKQSGILFYVPAQNTSKIDPVTGFINRLYPKYESVSKSIDFFGKFDEIKYNDKKDYFEFYLDYNKFIDDYKTKANWIICTYGKRIINRINPEKNNSWDTFEYDITHELKELFNKYGIDYSCDLKSQIINMDNKDFFERLTYLLKLSLQFRNSVTGTMKDEIISPVVDDKGNIFVSGKDPKLPIDADANGAYNIARKGLMCIRDIKNTMDNKLNRVKYKLSLEDFLNFVQGNE